MFGFFGLCIGREREVLMVLLFQIHWKDRLRNLKVPIKEEERAQSPAALRRSTAALKALATGLPCGGDRPSGYSPSHGPDQQAPLHG